MQYIHSKQYPILPKFTMSYDTICELLFRATSQNLKISIQLEAVDRDGYYQPDIMGYIYAWDNLGIYINQEKVHFDEIRHVEFI